MLLCSDLLSQSNRSGFETKLCLVCVCRPCVSQSNRSGFETGEVRKVIFKIRRLNPTVVVLKPGLRVAGMPPAGRLNPTVVVLKPAGSTTTTVVLSGLNPTVVVLKPLDYDDYSADYWGLNPTVVVLKRKDQAQDCATRQRSQSNRSGFETEFCDCSKIENIVQSQSNRSGFETG